MAATFNNLGTLPIQCPRILGLGDSITRGQGCAALDSWRADAWTQANVAGKHVTFVGANTDGTLTTSSINGSKHAGVPGEVITQITTRVPAAMSGFWPDLVTIMAGTNDADSGAVLTAAVTANYTALINAVRAAQPRVPIYCWMPLANNDATGSLFIGSVQTQELAVVNTFIGGGDTNIFWIDTASFTAAMLSDAVHPGCTPGYAPTLSGLLYNAIKTNQVFSY